MSDKELQQIEKALSLVSDEVLTTVMQIYLDNYGLDMEVTRDNCVDFLENIYDIQSADEDIDFECFYGLLTTMIRNTIDEMMSLYSDGDIFWII